MSVKGFKKKKGLKKENLRDHMTNLELVLNMLAETSTTEISKIKKPKDFEENKKVAKKGGGIARKARLALEEETDTKVIYLLLILLYSILSFLGYLHQQLSLL